MNSMLVGLRVRPTARSWQPTMNFVSPVDGLKTASHTTSFFTVNWTEGSDLNLEPSTTDSDTRAFMFDGFQHLVPLLARAIFPLIFALTVASLAKQSGFSDLLVLGLAAGAAVTAYVFMRLAREVLGAL
jgi:hypothetical protein